MRRAPFRAARAAIAVCLTPVFSAPAAPFSGIYGGTAGAGSALAWDRLAAGANPAALASPGSLASLAGYSPFGLEGFRVVELGAARDGGVWGASALYQSWVDAKRPLSARGEAQLARRLGQGGLGASLAYRHLAEARPGEASGFAVAGGGVWRPIPWAGLGAYAGLEAGEGAHAAFGAEARGGSPQGFAWRLCGEAFFTEAGGREARYAALLRLHALLGVQAGWAPRRRTAALGVRFGAGAWEGFSAMRRHAVLGGTAVQGLRWRRAGNPRDAEENR